MQTDHSDRAYEVWLWIELIGFDNELPDFGVQNYLDQAGFTPDAVSLFVFTPEFVHIHDDISKNRVLPIDVSSYGAHPTNSERARQDWAQLQLKGLVDELHSHGIAVWFCVFDMSVSDEWIGQHPEVLGVSAQGVRVGSVYGTKHLADGTPYQDFYAAQLQRVLQAYNFDGFHQGDGVSHPRMTLWNGDFSDDMTNQFCAWDACGLPEELQKTSGDDVEIVCARAKWLWQNAREQWIAFNRQRFVEFCAKVADAVHKVGKKVVLNNALTRDPFQGIYRFGVDYKAQTQAGADGFMVEMVAPGVTIGGESGVVVSPHYDFQAMLLTLRAYVDDVPFRCLTSVHDVNEQWDVLRHGPAMLEREIICQSNLYRWGKTGLERCSRGGLVCLADGLRRHEWNLLRECWDLAFEQIPRAIRGVTLVWPENCVEKELVEFISDRRFSTHKILYELTSRGAPVFTITTSDNLDVVDGPLLVLNADLLAEAETEKLLAYQNGAVVFIGKMQSTGSENALIWPDNELAEGWQCIVTGIDNLPQMPVCTPFQPELPENFFELPEPTAYMFELNFRPVSPDFLVGCAELLQQLSGNVKVLNRADVIRVQTLEFDDRRLRLFIANDAATYVPTEIEVGQEIERIEVRSSFPGTTPPIQGSRFGIRVPGQGIVAVDLWLKEGC